MSINHEDNIENLQPTFNADIIIVGAGPAGATAAYYLALNKYNVLVLDKQQFPRDKISGDFISPGSLKELQKIGVTNTEAFKQANVIDRATIFLSGKELAAGPFPAVSDLPRHARVVPRKVFDTLILEAARNAGARVLEGFCVTEYRVDEQGVTVVANNTKGSQSFRARLLIGADGNKSVIGRILQGKAWSTIETAIGVRGYFEGVSGLPMEANLFYHNDSFPGCSWIFPTAKNEANVGVGLLGGAYPPTEDPKELLLKLINSDEGMRRRLEHARLKGDVEVTSLNMHDPHVPIVGNRVMLVGEAAGLTNPYNGEGIQMGLQSARWAAETVVACNGDFSQRALCAYTDQVNREFGYGFNVSTLMFGLLRNRNLNHAWLRWIQQMGEKSKTDPQYARLISGVLSGMIFPSQVEVGTALTGALDEAALSVGVNAISDLLRDPSTLQQSGVNITQTGLAAARFAAQNPFAALLLGMEAATKMAEMAKQALKDAEKRAENQQ